MKKLLVVLASSLLLSGCTIQNLFIKKPAGLEITAEPQAAVFINDENQGETPYQNQALKAGSYTIRLVPREPGLAAWETRTDLDPQVTDRKSVV